MLFLPGSGDSGKRLVEDHRLAVLFLEESLNTAFDADCESNVLVSA
jgi:hypothetical protein